MVQVERPVESQMPSIARFGQLYSWSLASNTFVDANATAPLLYNVTDLPTWAQFDSNNLSISGTPPLPPPGLARTNDSVKLTATNPKTGSTASTLFHLITMNGTGPVVNKPLAQQLPNATSLGSASILPSGAQLLSLGWSFSLGFAGDTFTSDSHRVYLSARLADGTPLPGWMHFDQTVTLWGLAPTDVHTAGSFYTVVVTASDVPGYAGVNSSMQIVVSGASLIQSTPFPVVNATAGQPFQSMLPLDTIVDARGRAVNASTLRVAANTSAIGSWISFDEASHTFSGTPPFNMSESGPVTLTVPITLNSTDQSAPSVPTSANVTVYPSPFTVWSLPNVRVAPEGVFRIGLGDYLRGTQTPPQITFTPASASEWIHFDPSTRVLSGTPPGSGFEPVQVQVSIASTGSSGNRGVSAKTFTLTELASTTSSPARLPAPSRTASTSSADGFSSSDNAASGLSSKAKIAIAASLGSVGGLFMLILLMVCCRRFCADEDRRFRGAHPDDTLTDCEKSYNGHGDDDRTLADDRSPRFGWAAPKKERKSKEDPSPYLDPHSAFAPDRSPFSDAMTLAPSDEGHVRGQADGHPRQLVTNAIAPAFVITNASPPSATPKRSSILNLFSRATKSKSARSIATLNDTEANLARPAGLGLEGMLDRDLSQMTTSKSLANRESWESSLFYDDSMARGVSAAGAPTTPERRRNKAVMDGVLDSPLEVPVRRGPMRRAAHVGASPAFDLESGFEGSPERVEPMATGHNRKRGGGSVDLDDAVVGYARKVSVDVSGTIAPPQQVSIQEGQRNLSQHLDEYTSETPRGSIKDRRTRSNSQTTQDGDPFEDAEDDPSNAAVMQATVENTKRNSAASYVPDLAGAETSAVRYTDSRRGSAAGAVSTPVRSRGIASRNSEDEQRAATVRAVRPSGPVTASPGIPGAVARENPQTPVRVNRPSSNSSTTAPRAAPLFSTPQSNPRAHFSSHSLTTQPGALVRIPALASHPTSSANRKLTHHPVLQDEKYFEYYNTWPNFMHWLKWDEETQELSGTVPVKFGPLPIVLKLALLAKGEGLGHARTASSASAGPGEEEVAAIVVLAIEKRALATAT